MTDPRTGARRPAVLLIATVAAVSASLAFAGAASATKVDSGTTTLKAKKSAIKKLKKAGVKVKATKGATKAGKTFTFPITGGELVGPPPYTEPNTASGTVQHSGGLKFKGRNEQGKKRKLKIGDFLATFAAQSTLASTSGKTGVMLNLGAPSAVSADGLTIEGVKGKTARALRKALKKKFGVNLKKKTFGFLNVFAIEDPNVAISPGGTTSLTFAPSAAGKLGPKMPSPIAPATFSNNPPPLTATFPVTGGMLNKVTGEGEVQADGGVSLAGCANASGTPPLTLDDPSMLITPTGTALNVFSNLTGGRVNIADVAINGNVPGNERTITGAATINAAAAAALNAACQLTGTPGEFTAGEPLGTIKAQFTLAG